MILSDNSAAPGPIDAWTWTLSGPAGFTTETSVVDQLSTTLSVPGLYTVTLTACSGGVCDTVTQTDFIEVFTPPSIGMVISPLLGCPPLEVCFDGTFSAGCGTIVSSVIDVKDGTVYADVEDVCHTYPFVGSFTDFTVSVSNSCGCLTTETYTDVVTISLPPAASFASSNSFSCSAPFNVNFNSTSSNTEPGTTYEWNIPPIVNGANTQNINQVFPVGSYDVELIVTNPNGCADTIFQPNYVVVGDFSADFTIDTTSGCPGTSFSFTDLSSGNPIAWDWTFEGHGSSSAQNPTVNFTSSGSWGVSLVAQYAGGCSDSIYQANLVDVFQDPTNNFSVTDNSACFIPFTTTFTNGSLNADSTIFSFPGGSPATHTGFTPVDVTYNAYGSYSVQITSFSSQGCSSSTSYNNFIDLQALQASVLVDSTGGCVPLASNLSFTLSAGEVAASQNWTLPGSDIGASILPNPTAVYNASGCNDVTLSVATVSGCTTTVTNSNAICAGSPPTGGFSLTPTSFCFEEESVTFTYTGAGADTIFWDFGDNSSPVFAPDDASVSYSYPDDIGSFTVSMIPFQFGCPGDTTVYVDTVQVLGPISVFDAVFDGCTNWNTFNFTDQSVEADSVFYEFGDPSTTGDTSSQFNPSWIYPAIDSITNYTVTQYAYNFTTGCMHQSSNTIAVYPPFADFTYSDSVGCAPYNISFINRSLETGFNATNTNWNWDNTLVFGPGPGINSIWNYYQSIAHSYNEPGIYSVTMTNRDNRLCRDTITKSNVITIHGVNTGFTQDITQGCAPLTVNFTDTSNAPLSYVESLHWDFGVSGTLADTSNLQNPNFTYNVPGIYTVTLSATDSFGCTNIATSTVNISGPIANFSLSDTFFCTNQNVGLINQSLGTGLNYAWTFVNGTPASSNAQNPAALSYANEGFQDILLEVTDPFGCFDDTTVSVPVFDVVAQATASADSINCFANTTVISFNNTSFNNIDSSSVFWDLGNGTTSTLFNPSAAYNLAGSYIVSLSIASNTGCIDTTIVDTIFVGGPYGEVNVIGSDSACFCETVSFEVLTWNATNPSLITGDGGIISFVPNGILGDTILDTLSYQYCQIGSFIPQLFIDDGTCSGNIELSDTIRVDSVVANFGIGPLPSCDSGTVCFFDSSFNLVQGTAGLDVYNWDFGDGSTSNIANPCHNYSAPGLYNVRLSVSSNFNCLDTVEYQVLIPASPDVSIDISDSVGCIGLQLLLWDSTSVDSSTSIQSWGWDFGNGAISSIQNPTTIYNIAGTYTTTLLVTDLNGCTGVDSVNITIFSLPNISTANDTAVCLGDSIQLNTSGGVSYNWQPNYNISDISISNPFVFPTVDTTYVVEGVDVNGCSNWDTVFVEVKQVEAFFSAPSVCLNETTAFTDFSTSDGIITDWTWTFGEPSSGANDTSLLQNPTHDYLSQGSFDVNLVVTDDNLCLADTTITVFIQDAPIASFTADSVCFGESHTFNSDSSFAAGANIISYHWDFGVGGTLTDTSNIANSFFTYNAPGLYTVCLTIETDQSCAGNFDDSCFVVQVFSLPNISTANDTAVCLGDSIQLNTSGGVSYNWQPNYNISDISISNPFVFPTVDTTYVVEGVDVNGCSNWDTVFVEVKQVEAFFSAPSVCLNETTAFTDFSTSDGIITDWTWTFGEPSSGANDTSLLQNPTHDYLSQGSFDVNLVVTDDNLCLADTTITVFIQDAPIASFTADSVCFGESHTFNSDSSFAAGANIISYHWDFGVGGTLTDTSNIANSFFTYNAPGLYTVCLTIETDQSCSGNFDDSCFVVQVYELPNVNFILDSACLGNQSNITDLTVLGVDAGVLTSFWDFGQNPQDTLLGFSSPLSTQFLYDSTGQYNVTLTVIDSNLCASDDTETAFVFANPAGNFSFATACQNQDNEFVALPSFVSAGNLVYYWDFDEGLGFQLGDSIETYNFVVTGNHQVNLAIVDALGCSDTVQQLIFILDAPTAVITGDNTVCRGVSTTLSGSSSTVLAPPAVYDWSVTASQTSQITYSPNSDTDVFLTVTDNSGCVDSTSVFIDVLEVPEADFDWTDACEDIQISLTSLAQEGDALLINYTWNINSAISGAVTFNTVNANYTVPTIDTLSVTFIVQDANNCIDSINQIIIVDQQVDLDILTPDYLLCPGDTLLIDLGDSASFGSIGVGSTVWSPTAGIIAISGDSILLAPTTSISYNISASSALGQCPPDDDNFINVDLAPDPFISLDAFPNPVLAGAISNITAGVIPFNVNTDSLIWDNSSGTLNTDFGFNLDATPIEETIYPAQLIYYFDSLRCIKDTAITIFVITECNGELIYIPNIFTPNDDGKNDEFGLIGYGIEVINYLRIFDRWGQLLFDGVDLEMNNGRMFPGAGWLGENQGGKDCNSGVYVYTYELRCANGDVVRGSGNVTLIK